MLDNPDLTQILLLNPIRKGISTKTGSSFAGKNAFRYSAAHSVPKILICTRILEGLPHSFITQCLDLMEHLYNFITQNYQGTNCGE